MANLAAMSFEHLFKRCVECPDTSVACPSCAKGYVCSQTIQSCDACLTATCVKDSSSTSIGTGKSSSGPNVGAIAGGVIGGVAAIAIATYLVWRFCIKTKRQQYEQENWAEDPEETEAAEKDFTMRRDARASTHTVGSIASTVLTRASNIIQIAYIPGVTNRSAPTTPGLLVPPVPPIPIALSDASTPRYEQEHFFMPGDLRDSTWSGMSDRTSGYARNSVASTIYGKNAIVSPVPAQTMIRGKAAVVSVKSNAGASGGETPPVPSVDFTKYRPTVAEEVAGRTGPPSPAFSVGSTFLNNANTATQIRPQVVRVVTASKKSTPAPSVTESPNLHDRDSNAITIIDDTPAIDQGPFSDPPHLRGSSGSLSAVAEDVHTANVVATSKRGGTPFGDEHEMKE